MVIGFVRFLTIMGLATLEFKAAIPSRLALGLDPFSVFLAAALGATLDILVILFMGGKFRRLVPARHGRAVQSPQHGWLEKGYTRFGPADLGLLTPLLVGTLLGTALGLSLGLKARSVFFRIAAGTALWSAALTAAAVAGISGLHFFFRLLTGSSPCGRARVRLQGRQGQDFRAAGRRTVSVGCRICATESVLTALRMSTIWW